ncbi:hypothetical protein XI00_11890 [Bradyrhizobium sp. CCBAU 21359]|nr:hypothetical protein [Bradyrhizobium sp. CCBAU 21359]
MQGHGIDPRGEVSARRKSLDLACEQNAAAVLGIIQRLDPDAVARQDQAALLPIPQADREKSLQAFEHRLTPGEIRVREDLGVAGAAKADAERSLELAAQLVIVVDLSIVGDDDAFRGIEHRLAPGIGEIADGEPAVGEADGAVQPGALAVRPAMDQRCRHRRNRTAVGGPTVTMKDARYAAHRVPLPREVMVADS